MMDLGVLSVNYNLHKLRKSVETIESHDPSKTLFLYVGFQAPHGPIMKPPQKYLDMYQGARVSRSHLNRAATISALDSAVGDIVDSLKKTGLYDNTLILFSTDNGGSVLRFSNLPLRGDKEYLYEGGVRGVGIVSGGKIRNPGTETNE